MSTFTLPKPERRSLAGNPVGVTLEDFLDVGLRNASYSAWHDESKSADGRWCWHASQLCGCTRQAVLRRAGYAREEADRDGAMLLEQAKLLHDWLYRCALAYTADPANETEIIVAEEGYRHPVLNLAAKPDLLIRKREIPVLVEYKTEKEGAAGWRHKDAERAGAQTAAKREHQVQLAAQAMTLEACGVVDQPIAEGRVWYLSRQEWWTEECPVDLSDASLRAEVNARVLALDEAWAAYAQWKALPHRLDPNDKSVAWMCRPRSEGDARGKYCDVRKASFHKLMPA